MSRVFQRSAGERFIFGQVVLAWTWGFKGLKCGKPPLLRAEYSVFADSLLVELRVRSFYLVSTRAGSQILKCFKLLVLD
jgi:hypothetical protein